MTFADKLKKFDDKYLYTVYKELIELSITGEFPVDSHYLKDLVYLRAKLSEHDFNMLNFKVELLNEIARRWTEDLEKCFDNTSSNNPKECFMYLYQCLDKKDREKLVDSWLKAGGKETMSWWQWCMKNINVSVKQLQENNYMRIDMKQLYYVHTEFDDYRIVVKANSADDAEILANDQFYDNISSIDNPNIDWIVELCDNDEKTERRKDQIRRIFGNVN